MTSSVYNATLVTRHDLNEDLAVVRVVPDNGRIPAFRPGQYTLVGLLQEDEKRNGRGPRLLRRAYSIASSPDDGEALEFYLVRVRDGRLTPGLWTVPEGGRLWVDAKAHGHFILEEVPGDRDLVLVATGTGLAPYVSLLRAQRGRGRWHRLILVHGVRRQGDLGYRQEIEAACRQDPSILYLPICSREPDDSSWQGPRGRVQDVIAPDMFTRLTGQPLTPDQCYVFLCGHPDMIRVTSEELASRGFVEKSHDTIGSMHFEKYW